MDIDIDEIAERKVFGEVNHEPSVAISLTERYDLVRLARRGQQCEAEGHDALVAIGQAAVRAFDPRGDATQMVLAEAEMRERVAHLQA